MSLPLFALSFLAFAVNLFIGLGTWELSWFVTAGWLLIPTVITCIGTAFLCEP